MAQQLKIPTMARTSEFVFRLLLVGFGAYASVFIARTSFVVDGQRYFTLFDDAMISMRYASNLAHGFGLVWNPGGLRVEGYTNPLWVLFMAGWHLLPIPMSTISLCIQVSNALFLAVNLYFVRKIALTLTKGNEFIALSAVFLTAFYVPLNNWSLQGMEVGPLTLLLNCTIWTMLRVLRDDQLRWVPYLLLGIGTLLRLDATVAYLVFWLFLIITDSLHRKFHVLFGLAGLVIFVGGQTLFRFLYYGDLLPNTYYLKMTGYPLIPRMTGGLFHFAIFVINMNPLVFFLAFGVLRSRRDKALLLMYVVFATQAAYSIFVGGDAWEWWGGSNRYISPVMPLLFILISYSLWLFVDPFRTLTQRTELAESVTRRLLAEIGLFVIVCATLLVALLQSSPLVLVFMGISLGGGLLLVVRARFAASATGHWKLRARFQALSSAALAPAAGVLLVLLSLLNLNAVHFPAGVDDGNVLRSPLHSVDDQDRVRQVRAVEEITTPQAKIAVVWAGIIPYFANRYAVDLLGKNDPVIAHEECKEPINTPPYVGFWPGHMKWDYQRSLGAEQPDVIVQLWPQVGSSAEDALVLVPPDAQPYISRDYALVSYRGLRFYIRNGSPNIRWWVLSSPVSPNSRRNLLFHSSATPPNGGPPTGPLTGPDSRLHPLS